MSSKLKVILGTVEIGREGLAEDQPVSTTNCSNKTSLASNRFLSIIC